MPITASAKKALRQSIRRRKQNLLRKEAYKSALKSIKKYLVVGNTEEAKNFLPKLYKTLDKAAKTNAIKKNKASRLKSRVSKLIKKSAKD